MPNCPLCHATLGDGVSVCPADGTFVWEAEGDMGVENVVTIRFFDESGKTRMHFRQAPFPSGTQRDSNNGGWSNMFDRLAAYLKTKVQP